MTTLETVIDIEEIRAFKALYGRTVDKVISDFTPDDLKRFGELFLDDTVAHFGADVTLTGRDAILSFIGETVRSKRAWMWHSFHSPQIDVSGDRAVGNWTIYCLARSKDTASHDVIVGRYIDEYVRTPAGWRQSKLTFVNESDNLG